MNLRNLGGEVHGPASRPAALIQLRYNHWLHSLPRWPLATSYVQKRQALLAFTYEMEMKIGSSRRIHGPARGALVEDALPDSWGCAALRRASAESSLA